MTTNAWDQGRSLAEKHASNGLYVKLANDGDKVVGIFLGEPLVREVHWTGEGYEDCTGNDEYCTAGKHASLRATMNFYVPADKAVKVIEGGTAWFKDLLKCRDKYGLDRWSFEVERHGAAKSTKTTYTILPDKELNDQQRAALAKLELHDLRKAIARSDDDGAGDFNSYDKTKGDAPIDTRVASDIVARLKVLPRDAVDALLQKFGVKRVRDLKATDEKVARAFVEHLEAKAKPAPESTAEVDPFA